MKVIAETDERTIGPPKKPKNLLSLTVVNPDKSGTRVVKTEFWFSTFPKLEYSNISKNNNPHKRSIFVVLKEIFSRNSSQRYIV